MCDGSESASPQFHQTAESKQILTTLGQISKSVDEIKESAKGIKNLEQNTAILSQRIQVMAQEQAQTSATITILKESDHSIDRCSAEGIAASGAATLGSEADSHRSRENSA